MADINLYSDCPGFAAASRRESEIRSIPFLGQMETICGHEVLPMTLRHFLWLDLMRSPFLLQMPSEVLCEKPGIENDVTVFLWVVSPLFVPGTTRCARRARERFNKKYSGIVKERIDIAVQAVLNYVDEAWMDAGTGSPGERSYYSAAAGVTAALSKHYHFPVDCYDNSFWRRLGRRITGTLNPLDMPLKIAFQYIRIANRWKDYETPLENKFSDAAIEAWMKSLQPPPSPKSAAQ